MTTREREGFNGRFQQMDEEVRKLASQFLTLENVVNIVKSEQAHIKELFSARFDAIATAGSLQIAKLEAIQKDITAMGSEADKSPMGRALQSDISRLGTDLKTNEGRIDDHATWQNRVEGVLLLLKWLGAAGIAALALAILRLLNVIH